MTIKKIIEQEKDKVISLLLKQIVSLRWSERFVEQNKDEVENFDLEEAKKEINRKESQLLEKGISKTKADEIREELIDLKEKKQKYEEFIQHVDNVVKTKEALKNNITSYWDLNDSEKEITTLLTR